jgi:ornithine--oxo-acid transaminase
MIFYIKPELQLMSITSLSATHVAIQLEERYGAHNYQPIPVVVTRGSGVFVWDVEGKRYYDFLSAYSAVNQGHCHPKVIAALVEQAQKLTLISRAFYNDLLGKAEKKVCQMFRYDKALFMNSGAEAVETAIKLARRWGYVKKQVPAESAGIVVAENNFHGRTTAIISFSTNPETRDGFGPYMPGFTTIPYNDLNELERVLKADKNICAFLVEPIQGEAGVLIPDKGYLAKAHAICKAYNVLLITDEIQTGIGRTGKLLAGYHDEVEADLLIIGKALAAGVLPVSAVLANDEIMLCIKAGEHGSTFGGNPLAAAVTIAALEVVEEEELAANAARMGSLFREGLLAVQKKRPGLISAVRGKGLLNAMDIIPDSRHRTALDVCMALKAKGLLAKPTHQHTVRFSPPLVITEEQVYECLNIINDVILHF